MNLLENDSREDKLISRGRFVQYCLIGVVTITSGSLASCLSAKKSGTTPLRGPAALNMPLNENWLFGHKFKEASLEPRFDDSSFEKISLPHCVAKLSWQDWQPKDWQDVWIYRRHFNIPLEAKGMRVFLHFEGVMVGATPVINGHKLTPHLGGYLPFHYEITDFLREQNVLAVAVDCRWSNVPPEGAPMGPKRIDFLEAGGIHRPVYLQLVPQVFVSDVFAKPLHVLESHRSIEVLATIDAASVPSAPVELKVEMKKGERVISTIREKIILKEPGSTQVTLSLKKLPGIKLWHPDDPQLYDINTTLFVDTKPLHEHHTRIGLRDARFEKEGFYLNGQRVQLFGLNRHEIYPYVGFAMPDRVKRHDAHILRKDFNCNIVRCSHYPQSSAFLDACDELGLMVWEETPGFQYLGDESWNQLMLRDIKDMITRDRNHPSIIIWGTRANESQNAPLLYKQTKQLARSLDDSRPSSGSMAPWSRKNWKKEWNEDVFAYDDYHANLDGSVALEDPVDDVPYFFAEAVGQFNYSTGNSFDSIYRRAGDIKVQQQQALRHAQAHNLAASNPRIAGLIAWCGFEYTSLINPYRGVKYPGVADIFRIPKLGASFYESQCDPFTTPVIYPNFYWDFGPASPKGPGKDVAIFSNCEVLLLFINEKLYATLHPDTKNFPNLKYPPFFTTLEIEESSFYPELRIDGYVGEKKIVSRSFSSNASEDQFLVSADDKELLANGSDATRVVFRITDKYGAPRPFAGGAVLFDINGPGTLIGDNPFDLSESGGAAAIWVKTNQNSPGMIDLKVKHPKHGTKQIQILARPEIK